MNITFTRKASGLVALLCTGIMLNHTTADAQVVRPFSPRFQTNIHGSIAYVSNIILQPKEGGAMTTGAPQFFHVPATGGTTQSLRNDRYMGSNIDIDADAGTWNSSSADFTLPSCGSVAFAGLYWGAGVVKNQSGDGGIDNGADPMTVNGFETVKLKLPGATSYTTITAEQIDTNQTVFENYQSFADVTALVQASPVTGTYTVANIACDTNKWNTFGGWTLVIVYNDPARLTRNLTVFDGLAVVGNGAATTQTITVSGFKAPPVGDVNAQLGIVVYDGDRGQNDGFEFQNNNTPGTFVDLTANETANETGLVNDAWNSTISYLGELVTTKNPNYANNFGYDADIFQLYNPGNAYLRNSDSTATIRIRSTSETYVLGLVTTELDNFVPEIVLATGSSVSNDTVSLGETITFTTTIQNIGSDIAEAAVFIDQLDSTIVYNAGTLTLNGTPLTDAADSDLGSFDSATRTIRVSLGAGATSTTGGTIINDGDTAAIISYDVSVVGTCAGIGNSPRPLFHQSNTAYRGQILTTNDTAYSRPIGDDACLQAVSPDPIYLKDTCTDGIGLPVQLVDFRLQQQNNGNELCWTVIEDGDPARYILYAGNNAQQLEPVYTAMAQQSFGERTICHHHAGMDNTTYYQLRIVNPGSNVIYSKTLVAFYSSFNGSSAAVRCYPNPSTGSIQLMMPEGYTCNNINISAADGRIVSSYSGASRTLDCSSLPSGLYIISCIMADGSQLHTRFVKK